MAKKRKSTKTKQLPPSRLLKFSYHKQKVSIILDKVLIFRIMQHVHGRFWGVVAILIMVTSFAICFTIRPDLLKASSAISYFGDDVRTAPYFAGAMFFSAYGLWRWRLYLLRTLKRKRPVSGFIFITIIGLYLIALMPLSWEPVRIIHIFGMALLGFGVTATVLADGLLTRVSATQNITLWRCLRLIASILIIVGDIIVVGSLTDIGAFNLMLVGELMLLTGFAIWVYIKTYFGEGKRSQLSKALRSLVLVD